LVFSSADHRILVNDRYAVGTKIRAGYGSDGSEQQRDHYRF
jgi:hypothetical protein